MRTAPILFAVLALVPLTAEAKPKGKGKGGKGKPKISAKVHTDKAAKAHKAGKFDVALTELQAAYEIDPQPKLLFAIAQVQVKLDNCPDAIGNYEKFLAATKDKGKQAVVKQAIASCNEKVAAAAPVEPKGDDPFRNSRPADPVAVIDKPPPVETTPPPVETTPPPSVETTPVAPVDDTPPGLGASGNISGSSHGAPASSGGTPWYKDKLGDALVISGVAAGVVSVVMYTSARGSLDDAERATSIEQYDDLVDRAHSRRTLSVVFAGGGAVLLGAGLLRYALRDSGETRGIAIAPSRGGGLVTWSGGF